jgi:hypothetical protein
MFLKLEIELCSNFEILFNPGRDKVDPSMCEDEEEAIKFDDYCGIYVMLYANGANV